MEHQNGVSFHHFPDFLNVMQKGFFDEPLVINVDGTLDVPIIVLVIEPAVYDNNRVRLLVQKLC